jgi:hypothetical protein
MVFTELIAVAKQYVVYALRSRYNKEDSFLRKGLLPVRVVVHKSSCNPSPLEYGESRSIYCQFDD